MDVRRLGAVEPLAPRWRDVTLGPMRAGARTTARIVVENVGGATWRSRGEDGLQLSYHWLDLRGNAIFWDGVRTAFPHPVPPGATLELDVPSMRCAPGALRPRFDFVEEHRFWLSEVGVPSWDVEVDVLPLIDERRLGVVVHGGPDARRPRRWPRRRSRSSTDAPTATAHLVAGARPAPDWARLLLDAHAEGWEAVGPAVLPGGGALARRLGGHALGRGRPGAATPASTCRSCSPRSSTGSRPTTHLGLPAYAGAGGLFEGRAVVTLPRRSGRPPR